MTLTGSKTRVALRNILAATDFSGISEGALHYALSFARRYDSQLYVAHVVLPDPFQTGLPILDKNALDLPIRHAEGEMANLLISGTLREVPHQVLLGQGALWTVLAEMIEKHGIDLIVVGTHGRTGVRKLVLGSIAEEIFRMAPCPVLTVGPKVTDEPPREMTVRQILFATDFSMASERAGGVAFSLAQEFQAEITLLHVVPDGASNSARDVDLLRETFRRRLGRQVPEDAECWCQPEYAVEFGAPATVILGVAEEIHTDLIVMGVRQTANFPGHLPPATAYKVVCGAHCPVLTVRP